MSSKALSLANYPNISGTKNHIINGNFDVWQRATSQTSSGYGSDDRWSNTHNVSTKTHSRQAFTLGQTAVPNNPKYYSRTVVTTGGTAGSYTYKYHRVENVALLAGKSVTLSFWAKADASKNIAVGFSQIFGTGGTPSSNVSTTGTTCALTTSWQKFTVTVTLPSVSGKTIGTDGNDCLSINFWFDAGSDYNSVTNTLGSQSGTFDLAQAQLEEGNYATGFENRRYNDELAYCKRYYVEATSLTTSQGYLALTRMSSTSNIYRAHFEYPTMRTIPTVTISASDYHKPSVRFDTGTITAVGSADSNYGFLVSVTPTTDDTAVYVLHVRGLSIKFSAEL